MNIAGYLERLFRGKEAMETAAADRQAIRHNHGVINQHVQVMQSSSRVMDNMAGMLRELTKEAADRANTSD